MQAELVWAGALTRVSKRELRIAVSLRVPIGNISDRVGSLGSTYRQSRLENAAAALGPGFVRGLLLSTDTASRARGIT